MKIGYIGDWKQREGVEEWTAYAVTTSAARKWRLTVWRIRSHERDGLDQFGYKIEVHVGYWMEFITVNKDLSFEKARQAKISCHNHLCRTDWVSWYDCNIKPQKG